jgi:hypothetical protein
MGGVPAKPAGTGRSPTGRGPSSLVGFITKAEGFVRRKRTPGELHTVMARQKLGVLVAAFALLLLAAPIPAAAFIR